METLQGDLIITQDSLGVTGDHGAQGELCI